MGHKERGPQNLMKTGSSTAVALASKPAVVAASTLVPGEDVGGLTTAGLETSATCFSTERSEGSAVLLQVRPKSKADPSLRSG
jgi:hypothetical protein